MTASVGKLLNQLGETFWLVPGAMALAGILLAFGPLGVDQSGPLPAWFRLDAQREIGNEADVAGVGRRHATLRRTMAHGALGVIGARGI
jgi:hypothetical protein